MSEKLKVGEIPYLNLFPLFTALRRYFDNRNIEFINGHPSDLNEMLRQDLLDLSPSSSIEYARNYRQYYLVPDISVSSRKRVKSVILFSPFKIEENSDFSVSVTPASETSVTLLKIIFQEFFGTRAEIITADTTFNEATKKKTPYLLIGDDAIRESINKTPMKNPYQYDLGAIWRENTGLPFVFALWIVNGKSYQMRKSMVKNFSRKLLDAKKISANLIRNRNEKMLTKNDLPWGFLNDYWTNLSYDLDLEMKGLHKFFEFSLKIGEIDELPEIRFIDLV
ncbi:MAG: hypothetical protein GTN70_02935 [Deltaproteobacteria bacterium]|nr:hypothetical protein [Deltaproteobacteria bacterium]NIS76603.1 hypothetical protein [Deltaproteobacteria bacterium]